MLHPDDHRLSPSRGPRRWVEALVLGKLPAPARQTARRALRSYDVAIALLLSLLLSSCLVTWWLHAGIARGQCEDEHTECAAAARTRHIP
jgi:hypothetical protein